MSPEDKLKRDLMLSKIRLQLNKSEQMLQSDRPDLYDRRTGWLAPSIMMDGPVTTEVIPSSLNQSYMEKVLPEAFYESGYSDEDIKNKVFDRILDPSSDDPRIIVDPDWNNKDLYERKKNQA